MMGYSTTSFDPDSQVWLILEFCRYGTYDNIKKNFEIRFMIQRQFSFIILFSCFKET